MKKTFILILLLALTLFACGQQVSKTNITIQKAAPTLFLNGTNAAINFYNSDVVLQQSSNLLTLSGGDFSLGSNNLLGSGSVGTNLARLSKGWFTDFEITNLPTINGGTLASALSLSSYLLKTDTTAMLNKYALLSEVSAASMVYPAGSGIPIVVSGTSWGSTITNNSTNWNAAYTWVNANGANAVTAYNWGNHAGLYRPIAYVPAWSEITGKPSTFAPSAHTHPQTDVTGLSDSLLARYTKTQVDLIISGLGTGSFDTTRIYAILDSLIAVLGDTADIETILQIDLETDTLAARSWVRDYVAAHGGGEGVVDSVSLGTISPLLTDTKPWFVFGAGMGEATDSVAFAKGKRSFGSFNVVQDSLYVVSLDNILISANDSLKFNVYYGNRMTATPVDSLFTSPQSCGDNQTTFTPNNERTIPPGYDVWVGLLADQPTGYRPKEWNLQLNAQIRRD